MVRQVAKRLAGLLVDDKIDVICVLGGPCVGKTWLVEFTICREKRDEIIVYDDVDSYERFVEIISGRKKEDNKCVIVGRLIEEKCRELINSDLVIEYVQVYPMNFEEFKLAIPKGYSVNQSELVAMYMLVGGIPESVKAFVETGDIGKVREIQINLLTELQRGLPSKAEKVIKAIVAQETLETAGFSVRSINKNARNREYADVIDELIGMGIIEKFHRFAPREDIDVKRYKLYFYDIGMVSMLNEFSIKDFLDWNDDLKKNLLYDFYIKDLRTCIDNSKEEIKYWCKYRAKAKLTIVVECRERDKDKKLVPIVIKKNIDNYSRSTLEFMKMFENVSPLNIKLPFGKNVICGQELCDRLRNIT